MADISNVRYEEIKDITESLESLSCKFKLLSISLYIKVSY